MKKIIFIFFFSACFVGIQAQTPWYLTGNGSTDTTLNFIGTTDKKPLIFKTRDTERMKLLSDRSFLGIGVTNPQATLHLHYQTDGQPVPPLKLLQLTTDATANGGFSVTYEPTKDIRFKQQERAKIFIEGRGGGMTIAQDGKIGVGTDAPEEKVHIDEGNLLITSVNSGIGNPPQGALIFADMITPLCPYGKWGIEYLNSNDSTFGGHGLNFRKICNRLLPPNDPRSSLFLSDYGYVGIGNRNPQTELDIIGNIKATSANIITTLATDALTANSATIANTLTNDTLTANSATISGTLAANKLRVADLLCAKEVKVNLTPCWPDYVFSDTYKLMPLQELEQFVNENQHLPEIPSAATVEENGIEVGQMNAKLLKKIEELTLYILDLQKQIDELKK